MHMNIIIYMHIFMHMHKFTHMNIFMLVYMELVWKINVFWKVMYKHFFVFRWWWWLTEKHLTLKINFLKIILNVHLNMVFSCFWQLARHWKEGNADKLELACENRNLQMQQSRSSWQTSLSWFFLLDLVCRISLLLNYTDKSVIWRMLWKIW